MNICRNIILTLLILAAIPIAAYAADYTESVQGKGQINWTRMRVRATGIGAPPENAVNSAQARAMSRRAAVVVARRNLLEVVKHVRIDSQTRVENYMVENDRIQSRVQGVLKHSSVDKIVPYSGGYRASVSVPLTGKLSAAIFSADKSQVDKDADLLRRVETLEKKVRDMENLLQENRLMSRYQNEIITAFARMVANSPKNLRLIQAGTESSMLDSKELKTSILNLQKRQTRLEKRLDRLAARISDSPETQKATSRETESDLPEYTGLIVDARQLEFKPCLRPRIFIGRGSILYPGNIVPLKKAVNGGYARFYRDLGAAQQAALAGDLPLTAKAKKLYLNQNTSVIIADKNGEILKKIAAQKNNFLESCKVIFVF